MTFLADTVFKRPADNAIGFLRLMLASLVIVSHAYPLGGFGKDFLWRFSRETCDLGDLGVDGFFILSGALVAQSFIRLQHTGRYLWQRCLRIFPAYWVCLAVTSLVLGGIVCKFEFGDFHLLWTKTWGPYGYIAHGLFLNPRPELLNLFENNPEPLNFNNSLWTLKWEFDCYLLVIVFGLTSLLTSRAWLLCILFAVDWLLCNGFRFHLIDSALPLLSYFHDWRAARLPLYFFAGTLFFIYRDRIVLNWLVGTMAGLLLMTVAFFGFYPLFAPFLLPAILFYLAKGIPVYGLEKRVGDYSYGFYIYAYPVQQAFAALGFPRYGLLIYLAASFALTLVLAALSWHLIEKPALELKKSKFPAEIWLKISQRLLAFRGTP